MKYLLDTHTLIWASYHFELLSPQVSSILSLDGSVVYVSAVSAWEMATKNRLGKLPGIELFLAQFEERVLGAGLLLLDISVQHSLLAGKLEYPHKDPFDRMLAAQALLDELTLLSKYKALDGFGVKRVW